MCIEKDKYNTGNYAKLNLSYDGIKETNKEEFQRKFKESISPAEIKYYKIEKEKS